MIEMLRETGHYPAFIAYLIGLYLGLALIAFGLAVKLYLHHSPTNH
jgi:hypothetical protein